MKPDRVNIRCYQVGFGDCFLFSVHYDTGEARHVLIDFGSTGMPKESSHSLKDIARDIKAYVGADGLTAVVATHRHKDHISGFDTNKSGTAPGNIIAGLKPRLVIQPWTEDPDLEETATAPRANSGGPSLRAARRQVRTLAAMQQVAEQIYEEARRRRQAQNPLLALLAFIGEDNVKNVDAVKNLMTMSGARKNNRYLSTGDATGLEALMPGVAVDVLGPPTVEQHAEIKSETNWDPDEFWLRLAAAGDALPSASASKVAPLFPRHVVARDNYRFPIDTRWFVTHSKQQRAEQMLSIVTMLDDALNNTSLILLFRVGGKSFLFPGDAQIENWEYALAQEKYQKLLKAVDVYKVGHHGSRNATPKTLWDMFEHRSTDKTDPARLTSLMSTMADKHGSEANHSEVPRGTLVKALEAETTHYTTQRIAPDKLYIDVSVSLS